MLEKEYTNNKALKKGSKISPPSLLQKLPSKKLASLKKLSKQHDVGSSKRSKKKNLNKKEAIVSQTVFQGTRNVLKGIATIMVPQIESSHFSKNIRYNRFFIG